MLKLRIIFLCFILLFSTYVYSRECFVLKVLCYHTFTNYYCSYIDFSYEEVEHHIKLLQQKGWKFVTWKDVKNKNLFDKNVLITIDDGNWSVWGAYFNVFKKYNIKPVIGIYTYRQDYNALRPITWSQLKVLAKEGCVIVSHGYKHEDIDYVNYTRYKSVVDEEIKRSKKDIKENLGITTDVFIYPNGEYTSLAFKDLKVAGYTSAFALEDENEYNVDVTNNFAIKRIMVTRYNWKYIFE